MKMQKSNNGILILLSQYECHALDPLNSLHVPKLH